jgi:hypothetical protein
VRPSALPPLVRDLLPGWRRGTDYGRRPDRLLALEAAGHADIEWRPGQGGGRPVLWIRPRLHYGRGGLTACELAGDLYKCTSVPGAATCPWCRLARGAPAFSEGDSGMSVEILRGLLLELAGCWSCDQEVRHPGCVAPSEAALRAEAEGWIERIFSRGAWRWQAGPRAGVILGKERI